MNEADNTASCLAEDHKVLKFKSKLVSATETAASW